MKFVLEVLRGMVIGLANIIPGVSGGTMMVSMGIYDTLIHCITHLFKEFKKSVMTLLPYAIGMAVAIGALSFALKWAFANYALPTNTLFIGLILGGLPAILRQVKGKKKGPVRIFRTGPFCAVIYALPAGMRSSSISTTWATVRTLPARSSVMTMSYSSSMDITSSTTSRESAPRSSKMSVSGVMVSGSTSSW